MGINNFKMFSLFSGAGGMDLGFMQTDKYRLLLANDILNAPALTYECNFKHKIYDIDGKGKLLNLSLPAYLLGDVSEVDFHAIDKNDLDVMAGGPPCQDFSIVRGPMKERQGINVKRGRLYTHFIRALIYLQPKVFVFENVPGLKSANKGKAYQIIIDDFSELKLRWKDIREIVENSFNNNISNYRIIFSNIIDSTWLAVPQRRKRLIIIGVREDLTDLLTAGKLSQEVEHILLGRDSLSRKYPLTPLEVFEGLPLPQLNQEYKSIIEEYKDLAEKPLTEKAKEWKEKVWEKLKFDVVEDYLTSNNTALTNSKELDRAFEEHESVLKKLGYFKSRIDGKEFPDNSNAVPDEKESVLERQRMIAPDGNNLFVKGTKWEVEGRGLSLIYRRLHPLKPSYTVVAYGGGGTWGYHYKRNRGRLTNRERARLQTFPDWFLFRGNTAEVRAQIGEAVPPLLGAKSAEAVELILSTIKR